MSPDGQQTLRQALEQLELSLSGEQIARLTDFHDALLERNKELNLTGHDDERTSLIQNLINALAPHCFISATASTADIGTGGGFPGIPLAIALDMEHLTLIESKAKKARWLEEATQRFAPKVRVLCADANTVKEHFHRLLFCGFGPLQRIAAAARSCLAKGGRIIAYKGTRERIDAELAELPAPSRALWRIEPFTVPFLEAGAQRHLCIFERTAK